MSSIPFNFVDPPSGLLERTLGRLKKEERAQRIRRSVYEFISACVSLAALIPSLIFLIRESQSNGFNDLALAAFYDIGSLSSAWSDFGLALLEALPVVGLAAAFFSLAALCVSLRAIIHRQRISVTPHYDLSH